MCSYIFTVNFAKLHHFSKFRHYLSKKTLFLYPQTENVQIEDISKNKKLYDSYTTPDWEKVSFYEDSEGYITTHLHLIWKK